MKRFVQFSLLLAVGIVGLAFSRKAEPVHTVVEQPPPAQIRWYSWEEAVAACERSPRKIFVDVYTDWCGYCKRMDASTFTDSLVADYINKHFYAVKFNAEQQTVINYKGHTFAFQRNGTRGYHELAAALLDNKLQYPSFVYLDEQHNRITISPGYKAPDGLMRELRYVVGEHYKTIRFEQYNGQ
jgi:thioredoxin-related protein